VPSPADWERLARRMLRAYPNVQRWAQTDDVVQNSLMRLLHTLENLRPPPRPRDFFNLAAVHVRRELLDMAATLPATTSGSDNRCTGRRRNPRTGRSSRSTRNGKRGRIWKGGVAFTRKSNGCPSRNAR